MQYGPCHMIKISIPIAIDDAMDEFEEVVQNMPSPIYNDDDDEYVPPPLAGIVFIVLSYFCLFFCKI